MAFEEILCKPSDDGPKSYGQKRQTYTWEMYSFKSREKATFPAVYKVSNKNICHSVALGFFEAFCYVNNLTLASFYGGLYIQNDSS